MVLSHAHAKLHAQLPKHTRTPTLGAKYELTLKEDGCTRMLRPCTKGKQESVCGLVVRQYLLAKMQ